MWFWRKGVMAETGPSGDGFPASFPELDAISPSAAPLIPPKADPAPAPAEPATPAGTAAKPETEPSKETPAAEPAPAEEPKPESSDGAPEAPEPEDGPFKFAGRGYKDAAAAEHHFKSMEGRAKAEAKRASEAQKENARLQAERDQAAHSAHAWKEVAEKPRPTQETKPASETKVPDKDFLETLDWQGIKRLAESEGIEYGLFHTAKQLRDHMEKHFDAKLKAATAPFEQRAAEENAQRYTVNLFHTASEQKYVDGPLAGMPIYPELNESPETNQAIADIWRTYPPEVMFTPRGVHLAIVEFRGQRGSQPQPKVKAAPAPSGAPEVVKEAARVAATPPETLNGGGVPRQSEQTDDRGARFKARLEAVGSTVRAPDGTDLGFMP